MRSIDRLTEAALLYASERETERRAEHEAAIRTRDRLRRRIRIIAAFAEMSDEQFDALNEELGAVLARHSAYVW